MENDLKLEFVELNEDENPVFDENGNYVMLDEIDINKNIGIVLPDEYIALELYKLNYNKYYYTAPKDIQKDVMFIDCYIGEFFLNYYGNRHYWTTIKNGKGTCIIIKKNYSDRINILDGIYLTVGGFKVKYIKSPNIVPIWLNKCSNVIKNKYEKLDDFNITEKFFEILSNVAGFPCVCNPLLKCDADISFITNETYVNVARKKLVEFLKYVSFEYPDSPTISLESPYPKDKTKREVNKVAYMGLKFINKCFLYDVLDDKDYWNLLNLISKNNGTSYELISYDDVVETQIDYLWYPYIPLGSIVLFAGDPGIGKSNIAFKIASIISTGGRFPFSDEKSISLSPSDVIIQNGEDVKGGTIKRRLELYGADLSKIWFINDNIESPFKVNDLDVLERNLYIRRPKLVVIDPITKYLPSKISMDRANEVRDTLSPLVDFAERYKCTFLIIAHKNKNTKTDDIYRVLGSIDFVGICRSMLMAQEIKGKRYLKQVKNSTAEFGKSIEYCIDNDGLEFIRQVDDKIDEEENIKPIAEAKQFILEQLKQGEVPANYIFELAKSEGISVPTLKRAKKELGVQSIQRSFDEGRKNCWVWVLSTGNGAIGSEAKEEEKNNNI